MRKLVDELPGLCFALAGVSLFSFLPGSHAVEKVSLKESNAKKFVELVRQQKGEQAAEYMDARMKASLPPHVLESLWESLVQDNGSFQSFTETRIEPGRQRGAERVIVASKFQNDELDFVVTVNSEGKVANFVVRPHPDFIEPGYGRKDTFSEVPLDVVSGKFNLGATLCVPQGKGPFPSVVLVHASGPHDRDETVGSIKMFRDIAWGLASNGIAVLRYEKRSRQYPEARLATVNDETVDDAVAAISTLEHRPEVDRNKIFVLGHSLGAVMIPRISERAPQVAGFVVCAAPTQSLEDVILSQVEFVEKASGGDLDSEAISSARNEVKLVKQLTNDPQALKGAPLLGLERTWWLDVQNYDHVNSTQKIKKPVLLIQGDKDYQVTAMNFDAWKKALSDQPNFKLKTYPNLSHVFAKAGDTPGPTDYLSPLNVSDEVVSDLAAWIKSPGK
ncbi:MAG: alpha/beta fold hydrolase [Candidatus Obscuribacterales bacterium]|nr:alpha/beta fold hydrolase [Candidatus Obscuribacterales bacterium]